MFVDVLTQIAGRKQNMGESTTLALMLDTHYNSSRPYNLMKLKIAKFCLYFMTSPLCFAMRSSQL